VESSLRAVLSLTYVDVVSLWLGEENNNNNNNKTDTHYIALFISYLKMPFYSRDSLRISLEILCNLCVHVHNKNLILRYHGIDALVSLQCDDDGHIRDLSFQILGMLMYIYVCICIHSCVYFYIYIYIYQCMCIYVLVSLRCDDGHIRDLSFQLLGTTYTCIHLHIYLYVCMYVYILWYWVSFRFLLLMINMLYNFNPSRPFEGKHSGRGTRTHQSGNG
jgi:hypothetical protein